MGACYHLTHINALDRHIEINLIRLPYDYSETGSLRRMDIDVGPDSGKSITCGCSKVYYMRRTRIFMEERSFVEGMVLHLLRLVTVHAFETLETACYNALSVTRSDGD